MTRWKGEAYQLSIYGYVAIRDSERNTSGTYNTNNLVFPDLPFEDPGSEIEQGCQKMWITWFSSRTPMHSSLVADG